MRYRKLKSTFPQINSQDATRQGINNLCSFLTRVRQRILTETAFFFFKSSRSSVYTGAAAGASSLGISKTHFNFESIKISEVASFHCNIHYNSYYVARFWEPHIVLLYTNLAIFTSAHKINSSVKP